MYKVVLQDNIAEIVPQMEKDTLRYIRENQIESFESFDAFNLLAFDWYDIHSERTEVSKIIMYMDAEHLFVICRDDLAYRYYSRMLEELVEKETLASAQVLCRIFQHLFQGDMEFLDDFEAEINNSVAALLSGNLDNAAQEVISNRQELLRLKHYYEQIDAVLDEIVLADDPMMPDTAIRRLTILGARTDRYLKKVYNLQEIASQMQETYQAQLSIQQNNLMKFFTVVTAIFLPLTLLVGWYGMNFIGMPELHWKYGYRMVIAVSVVIVAVLIYHFKRKKWL